MKDKRRVDELSIEELEQILAIRKRERRMQRFQNQSENGRIALASFAQEPQTIASSDLSSQAKLPQQHEATAGIASPDYPETYDITQDIPHFEDEDFNEVEFIEATTKPPQRQSYKKKSSGRRSNVNRLLLIIEIVGVLGFVAVLYLAFTGLSTIQENTDETQHELAAIRELSRMTPTPLPILTAGGLVLPGGHEPFDANGYNFEYELELAFDIREIPQNQRSALRRQIAPPQRTTQQLQPGDPSLVDIPDIGKHGLSIVGGTDWETLKGGVGWFDNGARPGTEFNVVLTAHNDIYGSIFRDIHLLEPGNEIYLRDGNGIQHTYRVVDEYEAEPSDTYVLDPNYGQGTGMLTLITCYPYGVNSHRWVVFAELVD